MYRVIIEHPPEVFPEQVAGSDAVYHHENLVFCLHYALELANSGIFPAIVKVEEI